MGTTGWGIMSSSRRSVGGMSNCATAVAYIGQHACVYCQGGCVNMYARRPRRVRRAATRRPRHAPHGRGSRDQPASARRGGRDGASARSRLPHRGLRRSRGERHEHLDARRPSRGQQAGDGRTRQGSRADRLRDDQPGHGRSTGRRVSSSPKKVRSSVAMPRQRPRRLTARWEAEFGAERLETLRSQLRDLAEQ